MSSTGLPPARRLLARALVAATLGTAGLFAGCQDDPDIPDISSLRRSGEASFICIGPDGEGAPLERCPQGPLTDDGRLTVGAEGYDLHSLVTQTVSAEVAVVRVTGADSTNDGTGEVVDVDMSNPGVTHLRVGQKPGAIASTPGGRATFVGVSEVGKSGIFGLPTSCIFEPGAKKDGSPETVRDLTTWPACSLPSPPGDMLVLVDPADDEGRVRPSCDASYVEVDDLPEPKAASRDECAVDLRDEVATIGTRKLVVALPDEGRLVVLDAQALLDRDPGSFRSCLEDDIKLDERPLLETTLPLEVNLPPEIVQPLPEDLVVDGCTEAGIHYELPNGDRFTPRPAGMAARDGALVVADAAAPVVHLIDVNSPCSPTELEPFLATSIDQPERVVTTTRVAISPLSSEGHRFIYAIDELGEDHASIMIFDATPGAVSRTPMVRPGSAEMPLEPADRIEFAAPVKDVDFALFDEPYADVDTGNGVVGVRCDPDPAVSDDEPGGRSRPLNNFSTGAQPAELRGLFGWALLGNGNVAVIDIDDFDADCRRPKTLNPDSVADFRGCANDPDDIALYTIDQSESGRATVSDEVSCNVVMPHRQRSSNLLLVDEELEFSLGDAPRLASYALLSQNGRSLPFSRLTSEGRRRPIMLGVDFEGTPSRPEAPAQVYVGTLLRSRDDPDNYLEIDPNLAEQAAMVLPWVQPRAYPVSEIVTAEYEGGYTGVRPTGLLPAPREDATQVEDPATAQVTFSDSQALFCELGVQDEALTSEVGAARFGLTGGALERFVSRHTDYLQIASELLDESDLYWQDEDGGASCGGGIGFQACDSYFGDADIQDLLPSRDLRILNAYQDHLELVPRGLAGQEAEAAMDLARCCFPDVVQYRLRAGHQWVVTGELSGFRHSITSSEVVDPVTGQTSYPCVRDCSPLVAGQQGRAFELTSISCEDADPKSNSACGVGPRTSEDVVCAYDSSRGAVAPGSAADACIFDGLTRRFAIYRGLEPSERGMIFGVEVTGGFAGQGVTLTTALSTATILPVSLQVIPNFGSVGVVDSQNRGLIIVDMRYVGVSDAFY